MAEASSLKGVIEFLGKLGIYDVVLPFLLVFTLVFAILEKTKVLGTEEIDGKTYTRKNLNAIISFVIGLLVVASTRVVAIMNEVLANVVLLLILSVFFLLLVGSFIKSDKEGVFLEKGWKTVFMIIMFIGILLIFFNALGWLTKAWDYVVGNLSSQVIGGVVLVALIIGTILWITYEKKPKSTSE